MSDTVAGLEAESVSSADSLHISNIYIQSFIWAWENIMCYWEIVKEAFPPTEAIVILNWQRGL